MKNFLISLGLICLLLSVFYACRKEEITLPPTVVTASADNIYNTSARIGGKVSDDGGAEVTERGVYWDTISNPEKSGTKLKLGTGTGSFYDTLKGLTSGTKYYIKAYAGNKNGLSYGEETSFTTQISFPTVTTLLVSEVTQTTARVGGNVTDDGGFEVTKRGVYWGTHANPQVTGIKLEIGNGKGEYYQTITGLSKTIFYFVVAYATNIKGTSYGEEISFRTDPELPTTLTLPATEITPFSATIGGEITSNGGSEITERGIYWGASPNPQTSGTQIIVGKGSGTFSSDIENLDPATDYYFIAYSINSIGIAYGEEETFTTKGGEPEASILELTDLDTSSITLTSRIVTNELSTTVSVEYGTSTTYEFSPIDLETPVTGSIDTVQIEITGLEPNETYHARIRVENALGISYSRDTMFTTVITGITGTEYDIEGNEYGTIGIGYQRWMTENLRTTKYNNGASIPLANEDSLWRASNGPAYCWYNNDSVKYSDIYGALYNWHTVNTGNLCPSGWHVPTDSNFIELLKFLGGAGDAGRKLKEAGTNHWNSPNKDADNKSGFTALGGGKCLEDGAFDYLKVEGNFWSSSDYSTHTARCLQLLYDYNAAFQAYAFKKYGMSVRCIKDDEGD